MDSRSVCSSLLGVGALVGLFAVAKVGHDDTWDSSGTTDGDDFVHVILVNLGVAEDLVDGLEGSLAELLKASTGEGPIEVNALEKGIDFDGGVRGGRQGAFSTFAIRAKPSDRTEVGEDI